VSAPAPLPPPAATAALIAPETEAAVASSVGGLLRMLGEHMPVHRGGPTIEEIVREEMRPLLKQWLDTNLQALVERQVRVEIERIVGRAVS
jgi:cell pole-organizing protein PopZ